MKRQHDCGNHYKGKLLTRDCLIPCRLGGENGGTQADIAQEKQLRAPHADLQATGRERYWAWIGLLKTQNHHQ